MADKIYIVKESEMNSVVNAINTKAQTTGSLVFPDEWNSAIGAIETGIPVPLSNCTSISAENIDGNRVALKWTEPNNSVYTQNGQSYELNEWVKTSVRRKEGSYPTSETDGTLVIDNTSKNAYSSKHLVVSGLTGGHTYNFKLFPIAKNGMVTNATANQVRCTANYFTLASCSGAVVENPRTGTSLTLKWTDPNNITKSIDGVSYTQAEWHKTVVRWSTTGYPTTIGEGQGGFESLIHNQFSSTPYTIDGLVEGTTYYISIFAVTTKGAVSTPAKVTETPVTILPVRYGVKFSGSSPTGTRLYDAVGAVVNVASDLNTHVRNDFEGFEIFKDITYPVVAGDYFTRIPKMYWKVDWASEEFVVSNVEWDSTYKIAPAFIAPNGQERDYKDYGRFMTSSNNRCVPNADWTASQTRATFRNNARARGAGYTQMDIESMTLLRVLFMIVMATKNSQAVLPCNTSGAKRNTGDTLNAKSSIVQLGNYAGSFFGMENLVDGGYYWIDGLNIDFTAKKWYVCKDISRYADETTNGYDTLGSTPPSGNWITKMASSSSAPYAAMPSQASGGSDSTYYCDYVYTSSSGWRGACSGGHWDMSTDRGLFYAYRYSTTYTSGDVGARLVHNPL